MDNLENSQISLDAYITELEKAYNDPHFKDTWERFHKLYKGDSDMVETPIASRLSPKGYFMKAIPFVYHTTIYLEYRDRQLLTTKDTIRVTGGIWCK